MSWRTGSDAWVVFAQRKRPEGPLLVTAPRGRCTGSARLLRRWLLLPWLGLVGVVLLLLLLARVVLLRLAGVALLLLARGVLLLLLAWIGVGIRVLLCHAGAPWVVSGEKPLSLHCARVRAVRM